MQALCNAYTGTSPTTHTTHTMSTRPGMCGSRDIVGVVRVCVCRRSACVGVARVCMCGGRDVVRVCMIVGVVHVCMCGSRDIVGVVCVVVSEVPVYAQRRKGQIILQGKTFLFSTPILEYLLSSALYERTL